MAYISFSNSLVQCHIFVQLFIETFLFIVTSLLILLLIQLRKRIQSFFQEVSLYYYFITALYISFFKPRQDIQTLFLFQFSKLFYSQYTYLRSIYNFPYQQLFIQVSYPQITSFTLLRFNSLAKFFLVFSQFTSSVQAL